MDVLKSITSTLSRGSAGEQVKALQRYLIGLGYSGVKADGIFGPITESAVKQFQLDNGLKGDGIFGPRSFEKAVLMSGSADRSGEPGSGRAPDDARNMFNTETGKLNEKFVPQTQEELDTFYNASALTNPVFRGNSPEALEYAATTGDFSALNDIQGKPFSTKIQNEAMKQAEDALRPGFEAEKRFDTAETEDFLRGEKRGFDEFLASEKAGFETDKTTLDTEAANKGILFSGARKEREKSLQDAYEMNLASKRAQVSDTIANTARDYQFAYGDKAAKNPMLSQYYQLGGQAYNPNVARGGVTPMGLSSIYSTSGLDFGGTKVTANKAASAVRAANLLTNRGNKLLSTGYKNQF